MSAPKPTLGHLKGNSLTTDVHSSFKSSMTFGEWTRLGSLGIRWSGGALNDGKKSEFKPFSLAI